MKILMGKSVVEGIAIGAISVYKSKVNGVLKYVVEDTELEINRFKNAINIAINHYDELYKKALHKVGKENAIIFDIYKVILQDEFFINHVINVIEHEKVNVEYSLSISYDYLYKKFRKMTDVYISERIIDIKDVYQRIMFILKDCNCENTLTNPVIIFAEELTPSDVIQFDKTKVLAFVSSKGSLNSHVAILAKIMNIPSVMHIDYEEFNDFDGKMAIIDGYEGKVYIDVDDTTKMKLLRKKEEEEKKHTKIIESIDDKEVTVNGRNIKVYGNISSVNGTADIIKFGGDGIGLLRSEFIFMNHDDNPTEEEQFLAYSEIVKSMNNKPVVIRTFDYGSDKGIPFFMKYKMNAPDFSFRGIRFMLKYKDLLYEQLKAIYRASNFGEVAILYPMIISVEEVKELKNIEDYVKEDLKRNGYSFKEIKRGIMIETPAAVMISDLLAKEVDFFSIGTNDLTQYTLAIDRQNEIFDRDKEHLAITRMIELVINNGHKEGILVGICGEAASDVNKIEELLNIGVDYLSVVPTKIIKIKDSIRSLDKKP